MATNFIQPGCTLSLTAPTGGVVSGSPYLIGGLFVIATSTVAQTLPFQGTTEGVWTLAKTIFEADARRIVAAVNDVLGIPTAALESGFIREILVPRPESTSSVTIRIHPLPPETATLDPAEFFIHDRRVGDRRQGERRRAERRRVAVDERRILSVAD